ncbi:hypothetical protein N7504_000910 [Penicillium tannophilum]|nr:hypothetical protein N7504_000910 [Penicillium tannophilum]
MPVVVTQWPSSRGSLFDVSDEFKECAEMNEASEGRVAFQQTREAYCGVIWKKEEDLHSLIEVDQGDQADDMCVKEEDGHRLMDAWCMYDEDVTEAWRIELKLDEDGGRSEEGKEQSRSLQ